MGHRSEGGGVWCPGSVVLACSGSLTWLCCGGVTSVGGCPLVLGWGSLAGGKRRFAADVQNLPTAGVRNPLARPDLAKPSQVGRYWRPHLTNRSAKDVQVEGSAAPNPSTAHIYNARLSLGLPACMGEAVPEGEGDVDRLLPLWGR